MVPESETLVMLELHDGKLAEGHLAKRFERADYLALLFRLRRLLDKHETIRLLIHLHHFRGLEAGAVWGDVKTNLNSLAHVEKLAVVSDDRWHSELSSFSEPFDKATIRFFPLAQSDAAREWVDQGIA